MNNILYQHLVWVMYICGVPALRHAPSFQKGEALPSITQIFKTMIAQEREIIFASLISNNPDNLDK